MDVLELFKTVTLYFESYKILFAKFIFTYYSLQNSLREKLTKYRYLTFIPFIRLDIIVNLYLPLPPVLKLIF